MVWGKKKEWPPRGREMENLDEAIAYIYAYACKKEADKHSPIIHAEYREDGLWIVSGNCSAPICTIVDQYESHGRLSCFLEIKDRYLPESLVRNIYNTAGSVSDMGITSNDVEGKHLFTIIDYFDVPVLGSDLELRLSMFVSKVMSIWILLRLDGELIED